MRSASLALFLVLAAPVCSFSATFTWFGTASPNWSNPANWSPNGLPSAGDDLVFGDTPGTMVTTNDLAAGTAYNSLTISPSGTGAGYSFGGNGLAIFGGMDMPTHRITTFSVPITITASQVWTSVGEVIFNGTINLGSFTLEIQPFAPTGPPDGIVQLNQPVSGSGGLTQGGIGEIVTEAVHTFSGPTVVGDTSAFLCRGCILAGPVTVLGLFEFAPGTGNNTRTPTTGALTSTGGQITVGIHFGLAASLSLDANSRYTANGAPGFPATLIVSGSVSLGNAAFFYSPAPPQGGLLDIIARNAKDPVSGTFAGLPEGATVACGCSPPGSGIITYHGNASANEVWIIGPAPTSTALSSSPDPSAPGTAVLLTATVTASSGTPSGTVTFFDGTTALGSQPLSSGTATMTTTSLAPGAHNLTATYTPSTGAFAGSTSPVVVQNVLPFSTSTSLRATPNPTLVGQLTTLTATVTSPGGVPSGSVTFYEGTMPLAMQTVSGGTAEATVGPLARGDHTLTALFVPSTNAFSGSTSPPITLTVTVQAVTTATTLDVSPNAIKVGQSVTLTATVTAPAGTPPGIVTFFDGDVILGMQPVANGTASMTTSSLEVGVHRLSAVFAPSSIAFAPSASNIVTFEVAPPRRRAAQH